MRKRLNIKLGMALCLALVVTAQPSRAPRSKGAQSVVTNASQPAGLLPGQSATLLPNGRWLLVGGEGSDGPLASISVLESHTGAMTALNAELRQPRAWHTATLLPDGSILVLGGVDKHGHVVRLAEILIPLGNGLKSIPVEGVTPRAWHTASLLTDGRVLIAAGLSQEGETLNSAELWDFRTKRATSVSAVLNTARASHTATLLADGRVLLWGGKDQFGTAIPYGEIFDPITGRFSVETRPPDAQGPENQLRLEESLPQDRATNVPVDTLVSMRFSQPIAVATANSVTVALNGSRGAVDATVVPAEGGMLAFMIPKKPLSRGANYTVSLTGVSDERGIPLSATQFSFATVADPDEGEVWFPDLSDPKEDWHSKALETQWQKLPPLQGQPGVTTLAGQVLKLNGHPLKEIYVRVGDKTAETDETGRFLIVDPPTGEQVMYVNHRYGSGAGKGNKYCSFEIKVAIEPGTTNVIHHTIWLPVEDLKNATPVPVPTTQEIVARHPSIPGLEVHIPAGVILRTMHGEPLTYLSITPTPVDRTPIPLPGGVEMPFFFVFQAHRAEVVSVDGKPNPGIRIVYPNVSRLPAGSRTELWNYDAAGPGWYIYGASTVSADRKRVVPESNVGLKRLTCIPGWGFGNKGYGSSPPVNGDQDGEPVDLATGLFVYRKTDLVLPDVIPIVLTRVYRQNDPASRRFGIGFSYSYEMFTQGDGVSSADIFLPDGGRIHFDQDTSLPAGTWGQHLATPSAFYKARMMTGPFRIVLKDGTVYNIGDWIPPAPPFCHCDISFLDSIQDRHGNRLTLTRPDITQPYQVSRITSPNGRWVDLTYDSSNRIKQASDSIGRTVIYTYDASGRLWQVTDANGGITEYGYDTSNRMTTIKDPRGIVYLTNDYDANGRVWHQTQIDTGVYTFNYTMDASGNVTQTDVTNPRGYVRRVTFNSSGYSLTDTRALNQPEQQTYTYVRQPVSNFTTSLTDGLNRQTTYGYDPMGNVTTITRLAGTPNPLTTTIGYEPTFNQVNLIKDPLQHQTTFDYYPNGDLKTVTDALSHQTQFTSNSAGQPLTVKDPLNNQTQFSYDPGTGDLVSITDPLGRTTTRYLDSAGRLALLTNPQGQTTRYEYDNFNQVKRIIDPLGGVTAFDYDPNGNLKSVTDALQHQTIYTYNSMDRVETRKDPLLSIETYQYDLMGNLKQFTDRKGLVTTYGYDPLNRPNFVGFNTVLPGPTYDSTISYAYDKADRLTQGLDSIAGNIMRSYNDQTRTVTETTPQGSVTWVYDDAGRRRTMTLAGQPTVNYTFDDANRLMQIAQGTATVGYGYDNANRRTSLTLPNSIVMTYGYDLASQLTSITYQSGATTLGNLAYGYDLAGRRSSVVGSYARTALPGPLASASYNAANQLTQWATATLTYDLNGNMTSDGTNTYVWNSRNKLASINAGANSYTYDALGRRVANTAGATTTNYLYDGANVVQELQGGLASANLLTGLGVDEVFTRTTGAVASNFLTDVLGSTIGLTDSNGGFQTTYTYEPFGNATAFPAFANPYQFTGRENDGTGLYFYRARYYSPTLQRFISEDPIGFDGGANFYSYVGNDPLIFADPWGLKLCKVNLPGLGDTYLDDSFIPYVQDLIDQNNADGIPVVFTSAFRTTDEQSGLPSDPNAITPATPGTSLHEAGFAVDISWRRIPPDMRPIVVANAVDVGLTWGGNFKHPRPDRVHFQRDPGSRKNWINKAQRDYKQGVTCDCTK